LANNLEELGLDHSGVGGTFDPSAGTYTPAMGATSSTLLIQLLE